MSITALFFIEGAVVGMAISAAILFCLWASDLRDRDKRAEVLKVEAYERGFDEGYEVGGRFRFRERCQIARRCRELEKQIQENQSENTL